MSVIVGARENEKVPVVEEVYWREFQLLQHDGREKNYNSGPCNWNLGGTGWQIND